MKIRISFFLLIIFFYSCEGGSLNDQIMNYVNKRYKTNNFTTFYFMDDISSFHSTYYTYLHIFSELCSAVLAGEDDVSVLETRLEAIKKELVSVYIGHESDLEKAKQSEVFVILEQFFQQHEKQLSEKQLSYYKKQVDRILEYIDKNEF